ncbi:AtpZ/AtpI family protein [Bremerella sp. P1]|uniref:AtpZ/AtpI family protein n=1 Tax=Bremerella sp. P1 TaxID=3026424 RepID=UPI002367E906|nr:AtpZ/AtpI family protein [Bremerella sp. P1]WDI41706.1 AtpZ/AtpI family protein [Bremerella sp. P1]
MNDSFPDRRRRKLRAAVQRDISRRGRREHGAQSFWHSLAVLGMVGWPIALASVGGAMAGHYLDVRFDTGVHFTLMLLTLGTLLGCIAAWQALKGKL